MRIEEAEYELLYAGRTITADIMPFVIGITFSDRAKNESDEIEISLDDTQANWQSSWFPVQGETISLLITKRNKTLNCGNFVIDEITGNFSESGDEISIKAIGTGINKALRTISNYAHENKTIREIVNAIASKHGLNVSGHIPNITLQRKTQYNQTDLQFLKSLSEKYGFTFTIKGNQLIFTESFQHESDDVELYFDRHQISSLSIVDKSTKKYRDAILKYHHPQTKKAITYRTSETNFPNNSSDTLVLHTRVENERQAEQILKSALHAANSLKQEGTIELPGNPEVVSGRKINITGFGLFSGDYYVLETTHSVSREGDYTTSATIKKTRNSE